MHDKFNICINKINLESFVQKINKIVLKNININSFIGYNIHVVIGVIEIRVTKDSKSF